MKDSIPKHLIRTATISKKIKGYDFDFTVTFTVFGEVLEVSNHFSELPLMAQKLLVGNQTFNYNPEIQAYLALIKYGIPLIALGYTMEDKIWSPIYNEINKIKISIFEEPNYNWEDYIIDKWTRSIYQEVQSGFGRIRGRLMAEVLGGSDEKRKIAFRRIENTTIPLITGILINLSELWKGTDALKQIYIGCLNLQNDALFEMLTTHLFKEENRENHPKILECLIRYDKPSLEAYLFQYYDAFCKNQMNYGLYYLIKGLRKFPSEKVIQITKETLVERDRMASLAALKSLKLFGFQDSEIARILRKSLNYQMKFLPEGIKDKTTLFKVGNLLENYLRLPVEFWPPVEMIIDILEAGRISFITISRLLENRVTAKDYTRLTTLLTEDKFSSIRETTLKIFLDHGLPRHILLILPYVEKSDKKIKKSAIEAIHAILKRQKTGMDSYNEKLLPIFLLIKKDADKNIRLAVLKTLVTILKKNPDEIAIEPILADLSHENRLIRLEAIRNLRYFDQSEKVKHELKLRMIVDEDKAIQQLIEETLNTKSKNPTFIQYIRNYFLKYKK